MPCSPRDAGAVVAKNHVLGRAVHTTQTRPDGTPPGCITSIDPRGECYLSARLRSRTILQWQV